MSQGISYAVELVLCIDQTGSMHSIIDRVKEHALSFSTDLSKALADKGKEIDTLKVRVIGFRDYYYDGSDSMIMSDFFKLPDDNSKFQDFVRGLHPTGGGDEPESGLESLAYAIKSPWSLSGAKNRQVIVVWTDASAHPLEASSAAGLSGYPTDLPRDFDGLTEWWEGQTHMNASAKRLILFTPDAAGWSDIAANWEQTIHLASEAGGGLSEMEYATILDVIANSV